MSREILEILLTMDLKNVETQMALQCAPLIAGIKIANLLTVEKENEKTVKVILGGTGISYYCLCKKGDKIRFLLFYKKQLELFLRREDVKSVFQKLGYPDINSKTIFGILAKRYQKYLDGNKEFPHEIGLLLGYPAEDVKGFIENEGKNFLYSGYWKVYGNLDKKLLLFRQFESAKEELILQLANGARMKDILQNT